MKDKKTIHDKQDLVLFGFYLSLNDIKWGADSGEVKPLLRSLDSMNEDEARKFLAIDKNPPSLKPKYNGDIMPPLDMVKTWYLYTSRLTCTPEGFLWLITNGFDVFGWVEKGLAIEKEL